ncbi:probable NADH kinase [Olea europaea var. sylvestris]|uniref:NADH kinase n=1 Tax=Olea europaea subsp. europaea TaxID=158383 RepID=A0A8S0V7R3_OLEEU|nr:probable NADH kinase [Olea europaea var. sylvestris]CAA3029349.1 NADH kinase isoform X1 [Olea europaea subsp. europaea]
MVRKRLLLLLKPFDVYPSHESIALSSNCSKMLKVLRYLDDRRLVHKNAISFCQNILKQKAVDWKAVFRNDLSHSIHGVDLVISVGGDGTLLQASHFMDDSIPVLGVNSDPTRQEEVEEFGEEFDATRSTGYICAATTNNFERLLDDILENRSEPSEVSRMAISVNSKLISTFALNDILVAHPCPATVSRLSFRIRNNGTSSSLINCRSSGLRVSTAAGSTAAMLSAGGFTMPILSKELQYMVRDPISPGGSVHSMHGLVKSEETMDITWFCREGKIYIDGSHVVHSIQRGEAIELSSGAPTLKVYLPSHLLSKCV